MPDRPSADRTNIHAGWGTVAADTDGVQHAINFYDRLGVTWARVHCIGLVIPAGELSAHAEHPLEWSRVCRKAKCQRMLAEHRERQAQKPPDG